MPCYSPVVLLVPHQRATSEVIARIADFAGFPWCEFRWPMRPAIDVLSLMHRNDFHRGRTYRSDPKPAACMG